MKISDLFFLHQGNGLELYNMPQSVDSKINFVSRTAQNNGVVARTDILFEKTPFPVGFITVALGGSVLSSFVQQKEFYTSFHIMVLEPKNEMSFNEKLFYCVCIKNNAYRYSYGRQANRTLKDIELPDSTPDWIKNINVSPFGTNVVEPPHSLNCSMWKEYYISELFDVTVSKDKNMQNCEYGATPYVSSSAENNGVSSRIESIPSQKENTLTIARNGSVGSAFYQGKPYCASPDDIRILNPHFKMTKYSALFIKTVVEKEKYKYAYGRKLGTARIKNMVIKLPAKTDGTLNFEYMENYIKSLPYSDRI